MTINRVSELLSEYWDANERNKEKIRQRFRGLDISTLTPEEREVYNTALDAMRNPQTPAPAVFEQLREQEELLPVSSSFSRTELLPMANLPMANRRDERPMQNLTFELPKPFLRERILYERIRDWTYKNADNLCGAAVICGIAVIGACASSRNYSIKVVGAINIVAMAYFTHYIKSKGNQKLLIVPAQNVEPTIKSVQDDENTSQPLVSAEGASQQHILDQVHYG